MSEMLEGTRAALAMAETAGGSEEGAATQHIVALGKVRRNGENVKEIPPTAGPISLRARPVVEGACSQGDRQA